MTIMEEHKLTPELNLKAATLHHNPGVAELYEAALRRGEGHIGEGGPLVVRTNKTGRSPKDRFIVEDALTREAGWWGGFNTPTTPAVSSTLRPAK